MLDERTPLLQFPGLNGNATAGLEASHGHFCKLVGIRPLDLPPSQKHTPHPDSLYSRAIQHRRIQSLTYMFTATLTNTLLLSQVVFGAALTALAASDQSRVLLTVFGALNTVIAGLVAFLKARGQPVRARMFRDDLERVVDEIENSAIMWLGISTGAHGYDAIDTDDQVTVRSEVARLTRLYDRAVKTNMINDPDMYAAGLPGDAGSAGLRARTVQPSLSGPVAPAPATGAAVLPAPASAVAAPIAADPDESPASKPPEPPKPKETDTAKDDVKPAPPADGTAEPKSPPTPDLTAPSVPGATDKPADPARPSLEHDDESPATAAHPSKPPTRDPEDTQAGSDDGKKHSPDNAGEENEPPT
ncbi:hypothetical protein LTR36_005875 [Oleoguttula mirabilis]|uniref:SMODS and SLOG-associating 2TM effector domain-containing protein n=1 Tax=Oleoguttula mirabilis TaxID=1507867 RepID=A0AAV9JCV8_9PEZI|nr:hypothetical protein LTR36_005875 [Oleoguttula mirabilis]